MNQPQSQPTPSEAIGLLAQVAAIYKGTLAEHQNLQQAISVLDVLVNPPQPEPKAKKAKK